MEASQEGDKPVTLRVVACHLHGRFHGFRAGVAEINALGEIARRDPGQLFGELSEQRVIEIRSRHVNQRGRLLLDGAHNVGMAMAGGCHGDAGTEIKKGVAIDVFNDHAFAATCHQGIVACVRRRYELTVEIENLLGFGAGQRRFDLG